MTAANQTSQTKSVRYFAWAAIAGAIVVLPLLLLLVPTQAAQKEADSIATSDSAPKLAIDIPQGDDQLSDTQTGDKSAKDSTAGSADAQALGSNRIADASPDETTARPENAELITIDGYPVKRIFEIEGPFEHGDWVWDEEGSPKDGKLLVTVNLNDQILSVYRDGYEIGTAVILYGADEKPTPTGKFTITQKNKDHISNLYFVPMPYMMRLTNDGIAIHGSEVELGYATHGCVGVPNAFAAKLFAVAKLGTEVIIKAS